MKKVDDKWDVVAACPTKSSRMNTLQPKVIEKFRIEGIIKGGMGNTFAECIENVEGVYWLDPAMPGTLWACKLKDFGPLL